MTEKFIENEHNEENEFVALTGEDGNVEKFYHVGTIDYKDEWFVFFQPAEPKNGIDPDELIVFKLSGDEKDETLIPVDDEKLLEEVYDEFMRENDDDEEDTIEENINVCEGCSTKSETNGRGCASCCACKKQ